MKLIITLTEVERMKDALREALPYVKSSHRAEALARGLGWPTNASMRAALAGSPVEARADEHAFLNYLRKHAFEVQSGSLTRSFALAGIRRAMDLEPALSHFGYRVPKDRDEAFEEAEMRFQSSRAEMLDDHAIDEFIRAAALLSRFGRRKSLNRRRGSYGLKHDAERMTGGYVANGMFIAAALAMGFSAMRTHSGSPNAHFNISSKESAAGDMPAQAA
ncbi:hypothetical protein ACVIHH_003063 [Bradyrhizobium sp. USDA 4518]